MIKRILSTTTLLAVTFSSCILWNMVRYRYGLLDGFSRTALSLLEDTVWAPNFSEESFSKLTLGMDEKLVLATMGQPLKKWCSDSSCTLRYSNPLDGVSSYNRRWVRFSKDKVVQIDHRFYID